MKGRCIMGGFKIDRVKLAYILKSFERCRSEHYRKIKKEQGRELLILDKPVDSIETICLIDTLDSKEEYFEDNYERIEDITSNNRLVSALKKLTDRQKEILEYIYIKDLTVTETGNTLSITKQVVSKIHSAALSKIREEMGCELCGRKNN